MGAGPSGGGGGAHLESTPVRVGAISQGFCVKVTPTPRSGGLDGAWGFLCQEMSHGTKAPGFYLAPNPQAELAGAM